MEKAISATDANRKFSEILRGVRSGQSYVVTSHGEPIAKIGPIHESGRFRLSARTALLARLRTQPEVEVGRWNRDELYEDEP